MVDVIYNELKKSLLNGDVDWDSDTIKAVSYTHLTLPTNREV